MRISSNSKEISAEADMLLEMLWPQELGWNEHVFTLNSQFHIRLFVACLYVTIAFNWFKFSSCIFSSSHLNTNHLGSCCLTLRAVGHLDTCIWRGYREMGSMKLLQKKRTLHWSRGVTHFSLNSKEHGFSAWHHQNIELERIAEAHSRRVID